MHVCTLSMYVMHEMYNVQACRLIISFDNRKCATPKSPPPVRPAMCTCNVCTITQYTTNILSHYLYTQDFVGVVLPTHMVNISCVV